MIIKIIGMIIGLLVAAFGLYYLKADKDDKESRKIYGIISGAGAVIFALALALLLFEML